jgi:hypothetical protein
MTGSSPISTSPIADKVVSLDRLQLLSPLLLNPTNPDLKKIKTVLDDVRSYVNRIDIFENMFTPGLTGQVYLRDTQSLTNLAFMRGLDQLFIQFSVPDKQKGIQRKFGPQGFSIYNQSNRAPVNKANEEYVLGICSPEILSSTAIKFSRAYWDTLENIIKDIVEQPYGLSSKKSFVEREHTNVKMRFVVPYMRPIEVIQLLTLQGQTPNNETNYMFFETLEGYHFTSFRRLLEIAKKNPEIPTIYLDLAGQREQGNTKTRIKAEQLQVVSGFDMLYAMARGYFSSVTIGPDVLSGQCSIEISSIAKTGSTVEYANREKLNARDFYPPIMGEGTPATSRMFLIPTTHISAQNPMVTALDPDAKYRNNFIAQTLDGRNRELLGLQLRCIRGRVAGAPELHAGNIVNVEFPTTLNNKNTGQLIKDMASGRYIIINAKHSLVNDGKGESFFYETTFEAVTDSLL